MLGALFTPDAEEVKSLYMDKPVATIVATLLENLTSVFVFNKNEHTKQFYNLYQK